MTLQAGARLGPYEILKPLGAGGMGEVYRARDTRLGREVAIKVLPETLSEDVGRLRRFEKEAQSASSLNHPNIVTVYDIGSSGSTSYIAMELVDGVTLRQMLVDGALPQKKVLAIASQLAEGLAKAHGAGIVHRDLKPENVMVTKEGLAKILDFGLAKLAHPDADGAGSEIMTVTRGTEPGIVMGTVGYMSPEQALGKSLEFRSDQFSFGSMLYEMLTGRRAFDIGVDGRLLANLGSMSLTSTASVTCPPSGGPGPRDRRGMPGCPRARDPRRGGPRPRLAAHRGLRRRRAACQPARSGGDPPCAATAR